MEVEMTEENQILCPSCGGCCLGTNEWIAGVARAALFRRRRLYFLSIMWEKQRLTGQQALLILNFLIIVVTVDGRLTII